MATYKFLTEEDIDDNTRTIVKIVDVAATTQETEFTLEQKENELKSAEESLIDTKKRIDDLKAEISEVKTALEIT